MVCRKVMFLPVVVAGLWSVGPLLGIAWGEFPVADTRMSFLSHGTLAVEPSAATTPSVTFNQNTSFPQPVDSEPHGLFNGPVAAAVLVQYGLANNPEIQAARYRARALGARVPQAASLPDPQLMTNVFLESIQTAAGPQEVAMNLSQRFPWFGKLALQSEVAYYEAMAAYARVSVVELGVTERVKRTYYDVYFLQRSIEVMRVLRPQLAQVIEIAKTRYENSQAGLESVLQARVELAGLNMRLVELEQAKNEAQAKLAGILHLDPYARIEPEAVLPRSRIADKARLLVDLAQACQPELTARSRELCRDRASAELACRNFWPDPTVSFQWYDIGSRGLSPVATGEDAYSLSVAVNLPLRRKRLDAAVRESRYNTARSARQVAASRDHFRAEVQSLYAQFTGHDQVLEILGSEIVPAAAQTLDLSIEAYRVGRLDFQQLIGNYRSLLKYRIDYHKREAMREQAVASLERAVGCDIASGVVR